MPHLNPLRGALAFAAALGISSAGAAEDSVPALRPTMSDAPFPVPKDF